MEVPRQPCSCLHASLPKVVVDTFAEARQNDILNLAEEMEEDIEKDREALQKLFSRIDKDGSGQLSLDELIQGWTLSLPNTQNTQNVATARTRLNPFEAHAGIQSSRAACA